MAGNLTGLIGARSSSGSVVSDYTASTIPTLVACVGILADMIGMLPLKVYRKTADGREEAVDHPVHALLAVEPGAMNTPFELRRLAQVSCGFGGNGYMRVWRDNFFTPVEIEWLRPVDVQPELIRRPDGRHFPVYHLNGERTPLTRADVIHVQGLSTNGLVGLSPIRQLRESIGLSLTQREQSGRVFANGAQMPGYLVVPATVKDAELKRIREDWQANQASTANAGKTGLLWGGMDYKAVNGMSFADAQFLESRKFERSEIATLYRVPEVILGNSDKASSWGTGIETLSNGFLSFSLGPWLVNWEQAIAKTMLTTEEARAGYYVKFNRRALLSVALEAQAKFLREMRDIRVYSPDDCRAFLEENALPPGQRGDDYGAPFNGSGGTPAASTTNTGATASQPQTADPVAA